MATFNVTIRPRFGFDLTAKLDLFRVDETARDAAAAAIAKELEKVFGVRYRVKETGEDETAALHFYALLESGLSDRGDLTVFYSAGNE